MYFPEKLVGGEKSWYNIMHTLTWKLSGNDVDFYKKEGEERPKIGHSNPGKGVNCSENPV
jgi:hypothetical protein